MKSMLALVLLAVLCGFAGVPAHAAGADARDLAPGLQIPAAARPSPNFDVDKATQAYLNLLSPQQRAQSDAYFEGGYWLQLWEFRFWALHRSRRF